MKECKYCGTIYADNLSACPSCGGTKIVTDEERAEEESLKRKEFENRERASAAPQKQRKALIGGIVAVAVVAIAIIAIVSSNANKPLSNGMTKDEGDQVLTEGIAYFDAGDYEAAMKCFAQLPVDSKQYEKAQEMLGKCADEYSTAVVEKASTYATNGEYEVALNLLDNATELLPGNTQISTARNTIFAEYKDVVCTNARSDAENAAADGDYKGAIATIEEAQDKTGITDELTAILTKYKDEYRAVVLDDAYAILHSQKNAQSYSDAIAVVKDGLTVLNDDVELLNAITDMETYAPVYLIEDIEYLKCDDDTYYDKDALIDNKGNEYAGHYSFYGNHLSDWREFYDEIWFDIEEKYSRFNGTLVLPYENRGSSYSSYIYVYGDDKLIYQSNAITMGFKTTDFSVDVSGVSTLRIEFYNSSSSVLGGGYTVGYLTNAYLLK